MKNHLDLIGVLRANKLRITPMRKLLLQFFIDRKNRQTNLKEINKYLEVESPGIDRSSVYRNIQMLKKMDIIQELDLAERGKCFQYIFDRPVHHFYICKICGKLNRGDEELFNKIETALKDVHGFTKANLSMVFYGTCARCDTKTMRRKQTRSP